MAESDPGEDPVVLRQVLDVLPDLVFAVDRGGRIRFANRPLADYLRVPLEALTGAVVSDVVPAPTASVVLDLVRSVLDGGSELLGHEALITHRDGTVGFLRADLIPFRPGDDDEPAVLGVATDVTAEATTAGRLAALSRYMPDLAVIVQPTLGRVLVSDAIEELLGWSAAAWLDLALDAVVHPEDWPLLEPLVDPARTEPGTRSVVEVRLAHRDGSWRWFEVRAVNLADEPSIRGIVLFGRDVSERRERDRRLRHQATHDPLTGVFNRSAVAAELDRALAQARRTGATVGVLFCDLDDFKLVNDGLGHDVGDHLLHRIAGRLATTVRAGDTVGRLGGDEFLVVARTVAGEGELLALAERLGAAVAEDLRDTPFPVSVSIGAAVAAAGAATATDLVRDADAAMYRAKHAGKARVEVFRSEMRARAEQRLDVGRALRLALDEDTFAVHYQPVFVHDAGRWRLFALEALARCNDSDGRPLSPSEFIPIAEQTGMIARLGRRVAQHVVADLLRWSDRLDADVAVWINQSLPQLDTGDVAGELLGALERVGLTPARLGVEVTEATLGSGHPVAAAALEELRAAGSAVVLDDLGTGPVGLTSLKTAPVDVVKLDPSLVGGIVTDPSDLAIARSVVDVARVLGIEVVAEGVEDPAVLRAVTTLGCRCAQGYLLGRPAPAEVVEGHLARWRHPGPEPGAGAPR